MKINLLRPNSADTTQDKNLVMLIRTLFGYTPGNIYLYILAFRHKSAAVEVNPSVRISNERLEYLGDAILSAVVADYLFKMFPFKDEGFLTEMRSKIVSRTQLNKLSQRLGMDQFIESHQDSAGHNKSMTGDAFEAFIGALYLDKGYNFTRKIIIERIIAHHFDLEELETTEVNFKSKLLEWSQKERVTVDFMVIAENGSGYKKQYHVEVQVDGQGVSKAIDFSIKGAEQMAAEKAIEALGINR